MADVSYSSFFLKCFLWSFFILKLQVRVVWMSKWPRLRLYAVGTLTSFSLILLVAPLGFCSRSVPPSFSPSVPAPDTSWFSLIYNVVPLLLLHLYCYVATYLRTLLALRRGRRPFVAPLIILLLTLFRASGLSLGSMRPRSIPDAEAHGKDGDNRPQQLCVSNGELLFNLVFEWIILDFFR